MSDLSQNNGLMAVYRDDVLSEEYVEDRMDETPLVTLWGEQIVDGGFDYSISVNELLVLSALDRCMNEHDPWHGQSRNA